ncbi:MAG: methionine--tRNA ligase [Bacteroidetes bacterium]|nr:methionine--tRNA ligase [Bacteroidota bacterium]
MKPSAEPRRYLVTSALPYANGPIHIGHLAGAFLPADIYVRYLRSMAKDVLYVCGSDEHGVAITLRAQKEHLTPREIIDKYHPVIRDSLKAFGISFDNYSRTSLPIHRETAQEFFTRFAENKEFEVFEQKETEQLYDPKVDRFLPDRYVTGTCPVCNSPGAYGDQCEKCGSSLSPTDLIDPRSAYTGETPVLRKTSHWFLRLDKMQQDWLNDFVAQQQDRWKPNVYGQCKSWLDGGLQPRAITRDLDWGIPVPLPDAEGKVLYVWFDAPIGYISSTKEWALQRGTPDAWKPYWQDPDTALVHFIGKDNIVFHTLIFPAMLHYHGDYIVPWQIPANEFLNLEGDKMSTSRNYAVWLHEYLQDFPGKEDVLRYVLAATLPETKDNDFTWKDFQARNNNELVAILGNFVNRVLTLVQKYYQGAVPRPVDTTPVLETHLTALKQELETYVRAYSDSMERFRFRDALTALMNMARAGNGYLQQCEPWKLARDQSGLVPGILYHGVQVCALLAAYMEPFLPFTAGRLWDMLNTPRVSLAELQAGEGSPAALSELVPAGTLLPVPPLLFDKIEDDTVAAQVARLQPPATQTTTAPLPVEGTRGTPELSPAKPEIQFPDFEKLDIRVATITAAERVPKADRLLKLTLDTGLDTRTVVSGIAEHYAPEAIVGQRVCLLANLAPRKLKGIDSQGMVLMAESPEGTLRFVVPAEDLPNGSVVR